jgi:hypothetical protein
LFKLDCGWWKKRREDDTNEVNPVRFNWAVQNFIEYSGVWVKYEWRKIKEFARVIGI